MGKIVTKEEYVKLKSTFSNQKVGLCHGVFDLVHPGHIIHFEEAKAVCDILIVSVTAAKYVRKGPGRPYFDDEMRLKFLSSISCIDYVMLSEGYTVDDIVECVEPDLYIKGEEYAVAEDDVTGMIDKEVELVREHGGNVYYTQGQVFSSTKLLNRGFSALPPEVLQFSSDFIKRHSMDDIRHFAEKVKDLKVLVIGDVIIDKYTYCSVQGLMSKDMGYSARFKDDEEYMGGSIAVARHLAAFNNHVTLASVVGNEEDRNQRFKKELRSLMKLELIQSNSFPTIVKHRYLQRNQRRDDLHKIFAINNIPDPVELDEKTAVQFKKKIEEIIDEYDVVFLCDFGHGLVDEDIMNVIQDRAKFLALNCQTNSTNYGLNIITKYKKADVFTLDQTELKLAYPFYDMTEENALKKLAQHLGARGWLTRGSMGAYGVEGDMLMQCPAFTLDIIDTIGAGDAFYSVASLYVAAGASVELGMFMGNIAGALATNIVGNKESLEKANVLKYAGTILNV
ncbi:MAG: adenylyltransferase/cytidyltransferase family protein [Lachnospiraceae bacterium]|nr:adenylyltransferase/cytidyltransferase family protein [Lachnospiraceae bacterium]